MIIEKIKNIVKKEKMKVIKNPRENTLRARTVSALISRLPREKETDEYKTIIIKLFNINNPHKTAEYPHTTYEFTNIEKARILGLNVSYYLEGNDLVINDLEEIYILHDGKKLIIKGYQHLVEKRN